jgi:hypothetical protein
VSARPEKKLIDCIGKFVWGLDHHRVAGMRSFAQLAVFQQAYEI